MIVKIDTRSILDKTSFHQVFAAAFGFSKSYGQNMDAWIDCMTCLDDPTAEMTKVNCQKAEVVTLQLEYALDFSNREPELFQNILDCSAFANWRRIERGEQAILALSYYK